MKVLLFRLTLSIVLFLASTAVTAGEVTVAVASNFAGTMQKLVAEFEAETNHRVRLALGSSGKLYAQIRHGAPFDLFLSADQTKPIALENEGLALNGSRFTYATGTLVLWSAGELNVEHALKTGRFNKLALANARLAPYGEAAVDVLDNLGLTQATRSKWVLGENIAQTYQFVSTGNALLGFVALSQVIDNTKVDPGSAWIVPSELYQPVRQDAVLLNHGRENAAARALLDFIRSPAAAAIILADGYQTER